MKQKELIKEYDTAYMEILCSIEGEYMSKRQINRRIAREWNVPYDVVLSISNKSDEIFNIK